MCSISVCCAHVMSPGCGSGDRFHLLRACAASRCVLSLWHWAQALSRLERSSVPPFSTLMRWSTWVATMVHRGPRIWQVPLSRWSALARCCFQWAVLVRADDAVRGDVFQPECSSQRERATTRLRQPANEQCFGALKPIILLFVGLLVGGWRSRRGRVGTAAAPFDARGACGVTSPAHTKGAELFTSRGRTGRCCRACS